MVNPVYIDFNAHDGNHYEFRHKNKNGKVYVYLRPKHWSKSKRRMVFDKATLLGVQVPDDPTKLELIGQRRKEFLAKQQEVKPSDSEHSILDVTVTHGGAMDIIDHMFEASHIDAQVAVALADLDPNGENNLVVKVCSTMRYMVLCQTAVMSELDSCQLNHQFPYEKRLTESDIGLIYKTLGRYPRGKMIFFQERYHLARDAANDQPICVAFDSSMLNSYTTTISMVRKSYDEVNSKTKSVKLFMLYEIKNRMPVAWFLLPGNITDSKAMNYAIQQLHSIGLHQFELVADAGFITEENLSLLESNNVSYLIRSNTYRSVIRQALKDHMTELDHAERVDDEYRVKGLKVHLDNSRILYLFKDIKQNDEESCAFLKTLGHLKEAILTPYWSEDKLEASEQRLMKKYLVVDEMFAASADAADKQSVQRKVSFQNAKVEEFCSMLGTFAFFSSKDITPKEIYQAYISREKIEECYGCFKGDLDTRLRVQGDKKLEGRMFVMFGAICWLQYFQTCITTIKEELNRFKLTHEKEKGYMGQVRAYSSLLSWLKNTSLKQILDWFDVRHDISVHTKAADWRWSAPILKRDQLFLAFLGLAEFPKGFKELPNWEWLPKQHKPAATK